ncbi:MAG: T9SS type A sorting domain-containing protein [Candidatus Cloacimonadales bacterium]
MKKRNIYFVIVVLAIASLAFAQNAPIDFEEGGYGADWTWTVFENETNPPLEIIANPDASGANTSVTVAQFTALEAGQPWAGFESQHGADIGDFSFSEDNCIVKVMVWKPVISDVGVKFVEANGEAQPEVKVANTVTNQWEELTFDLSGSIGAGITGIIDQIVIFPDFDLEGRTSDNICYIDNVTFHPSSGGNEDEPEAAAPTPTIAAENVVSLFSNAYDNVPVDTWSADWDQADLQDIQIAGNDTKLYTNLVYAGIEFTSQTIDASEMTHFHLDIWTPDNTAAPAVFKIKLVDFGENGVWDGGGDDVEHELTFDENTLSSNQWVSFDIPLSDFVDLVTTGHLAQLIISGDPNTVYVDNVYFHNAVNSADFSQTIKPQSVLQNNYPNPFNPTTNISYTIAEPGLVEIKIFNLKGQMVDVLSEGNKSANSYQVFWEAENQASGIYFYSLQINGKNVDTKSMILLK